MSWKNYASVAVCALLAAPALAAPSLQITSGGLNAQGDWIWNVSLTPDASLFAINSAEDPTNPGGSVAVELGIAATGSDLSSATKNATNFPEDNPGESPFGAPINGEQTGIVTDGNNAFAGLGSDYFTAAGAQAMLTVVTDGPSTTGSLTSSLVVSGAYAGSGRVAQAGDNYDGFTGTASRTAKAGDANLDGTANIGDFLILQNNFNQTGKHFGTGDFNGDGTTNIGDFLILQNNFNQAGGSNTPLNVTGVLSGPGAGGSAAIPEPASIALAGLALLAGLGLARRK